MQIIAAHLLVCLLLVIGVTSDCPSPQQVWQYRGTYQISSSPVLSPSGKFLYVATGSYIVAFDSQGLTPIWNVSTNGLMHYPPAVGSTGTIFYADTNNGTVHALNGMTGQPMWAYQGGREISTQIAVGASGSVYYVPDDTEVLFALNGKTGALLWNCTVSAPTPPMVGPDGTVYVGFAAVNGKTGSLIWQYNTTSMPYSYSWDAIGPNGAECSNQVYVSTSDNYLYALNSKNGALMWRKLMGQYLVSAPYVGPDGTVYVGGDSFLVALNCSTGNTMWNFTEEGYASSAVFADGVVYSGSEQNFYALNSSSGNCIWNYNDDFASFGTAAAIAGSSGIVYVNTGGYNGLLGLNFTQNSWSTSRFINALGEKN